ncbi:MAG: bifunctional phosphopantothenoylcysteine decarboxylase/phosphopantothenate synthase [Candidatus Kapabacteria bacterium]|nr:bifunctional phosphopantothenoylcysteine decarboxylase/phosphopantothenate synthase [Candidatus Kapabacteria bacterium]
MKVILGITGSISAYKTPWLVRDLRRAGHDVRVVMTPSAREFVAPLALEATSLNPVIIDQYDPNIQDRGSWHVHLARWADVMLIAPCSATTLARLANGICDTAVMTVACSLPADTPLVVAPAMDTDMWDHPTTRRNVDRIAHDGAIVIPPASGPLASGLVGAGRLPELDTLVQAVLAHGPLTDAQPAPSQADAAQPAHATPRTADPLAGKRVVITAGPTYEAIDAVRFIGNHSSGRMGIALAQAARDRGALVTLVLGPSPLAAPLGVETVHVTSAREMYDATLSCDYDVAILSAAVADFTPALRIDGKLKKADVGQTLTLNLVRTDDILATLGERKRNGQRLVGFALEAADVVAYATDKLLRKNADMIVANLAGGTQSGFGGTDNTITIVTRNAEPKAFPPMSKRACADVILDAINTL